MRRKSRIVKGWRTALAACTILYLSFLLRNTIIIMRMSDFQDPPAADNHLDGFASKPMKDFLSLPDNRTLIRNPTPAIGKTEEFPAHDSKKLPSAFDKGGLIFFLHIPKTGGSTIRRNLEEREGIIYHFVSGAGIYKENIPHVRRYVSTETKRKRNVVILEVHGRDSPNLLQLRKTLLGLKRMATKQNVPTFFFTVVRDPMAYAISYFNFFHVQYGRQKYFPQVEPTESNLLKYSLYNPQCQFLARGEFSLRNMTHKQVPSEEECQEVHKVLLETMDWVGTTERLSVEILPMLRRVLKLEPEFEFQRFTVSKKFPNESISYNQLSQSGIERIQSMSRLDSELYGKLHDEFAFAGLD
jgi:hypothetical protein